MCLESVVRTNVCHVIGRRPNFFITRRPDGSSLLKILDFGISKTPAEVTELTRQIDVSALREYRDAVGRRTRDVVGGFKPQDWEGTVGVDAVQRAASQGAFGVRTEQIVKAFPGRPRAAMLSGIALFHSAGHIGEAATVRSAGGFGTGI